MKILYLIPGTGMPKDEIERRIEIANSITRYGTTVTVREVGEGPLSIESTIEEEIAIGPMLEYLLELRGEGSYDAVIIGCAGDPGLTAARELMDIPVVGPAESSYLFACMIADRFSIMTPLHAGKESEARVRSRLREMGLESRLASVVFSHTAIDEMWGKSRDVIVSELSRGVEASKRKGAGCVVLGCMSMAFLLVDELVETSDMPVINPLKTAIKTAEMFVDLGALHSRVTYPAADLDKLQRTAFKRK
jgi:allantoin racemase